MLTTRLFIVAAVLLIVGLVTLFSAAQGNAGANFGAPISVNSVTVNLTAHGAPALIGLLTLITGAVIFLIALIAAVVSQFRESPKRTGT